MKRILNIIIIILLSAICLTGTAQKIAVKSNLLGWATATPTLGAEIGLDDRWTLNTHIYYNPFTFRDNRKWKHIRVQPEVRYWLCQKFNGHFFGLHLLYTHINAGQVPLPFGIFPDVKKSLSRQHLRSRVILRLSMDFNTSVEYRGKYRCRIQV